MVSKLELVVAVLLSLLFRHQNDGVIANSFYSLQQQQPPSCHDEERSALLQFFNSASAQYSRCRPDDLGETSNCCTWRHVYCDKTGYVTNLNLIHCNFSGLVPSSLGNLRQLRKLKLSVNSFNGAIPAASLANLTQLIELDLHKNDFTGSIPSSLGNLSKLEVLWISSNQLSGPIPSSLGNLSRLTDLNAGFNNLQGSIPECLFNLINLKQLALRENNLSGTVEFHTMTHRLRHLTRLDLTDNRLKFLSPRNDSSPPVGQLLYLGLGRCNIREFPDFLRYQQRLRYLDLSRNKLRGQIPKWFFNMSTTSLMFLSISHNFLSSFAQPPGLVLPWLQLTVLDLSSNMLHGSLPIPHPRYTSYYGISENELTGEISPLICNLSSIVYLDLSDNKMSGKLPECLGNLSLMQVLKLGNNFFDGVLPQTYSKTSVLKMLDVSHNQLQGRVPRSLENCQQLAFLVLSNNEFDDSFPFWLGTLPELKILAMRNGGFQGVIGAPVQSHITFPKLSIFDVSHNNFTGEFPSQYMFSGNFVRGINQPQSTYLTTELVLRFVRDNLMYSITITNKGVERWFSKIHEGFTAIDLSSNNFEGKIPDFIGDLKGLRSLNISNNNFMGWIPLSLVNLRELESLDLSQNMLSGEIPQQVAQLTFLSQFNVSHNNLTGHIPRGSQLDTFDHTSYEGNPGLCGDPLAKKCGNDAAPPSSIEENDSGSDAVFEFDWRFILAGCGSGLVIGVVLADVTITRRQEMFLMIVGILIRTMKVRSYTEVECLDAL